MSEASHGHQEQGPQFTQRFVDAVDSVRGYNDRHAAGGMGGLTYFLREALHADDEEQVPRHEEAQMEKEMVSFLHTDDLRAMGIDLIDPSQPSLEPLDPNRPLEEEGEEDAAKQPPSLYMLIGDADTFADTVRRLKPAPEQRAQAESSIDHVLSSSVGLIQFAYPGRGGGPEEDEPGTVREEFDAGFVQGVANRQLGIFLKISPALVEEGFAGGRTYKQLAEYTTHFFAGTLEDYRGAEELHLFEDFGPARWQTDMAPEEMSERWTKAFDYLKQLRDRSQPSPFFTELFNKLRADFDTSREWLESDDPEAPRPGYREGYMKSLKEVMDGLSKRWETDFPLENGFYVSGTAEEGETENGQE